MASGAEQLRRSSHLSAIAIWLWFAAGGTATSSPREVIFNRDVRPILSDYCFQCHGPDEKHREAGLRLDTKDGAYATLESGEKPLIPGNRQASALFRRISSTDPTDRMPPIESSKSLSPAQVELLGRWIDAGASWQTHWSLIPPMRPQPPSVQKATWAQGTIDQFVLKRLKEAGLEPSLEADRTTLIRRLCLDLIGLPPTSTEVDAFVNNESPTAYGQLVERLLASRHFGERLAIPWLDLVRYADTTGFHSDEDRAISPYRDYVINAFNANLPFDQFTIEQLAGDLLPNATREQRVASSYNMLGMTSNENGIQEKEYLAKYAAGRVRNVSSVWMAATLGCAECHDHKYDPYTTRDFYRLAAFFADIRQRGMYLPVADLLLPTDQQAADLAELDAQITKTTEELAAYQHDHSLMAPPENLVAVLALAPGDRTAAQQAAMKEYFAKLAPELARLYQRTDDLLDRRTNVALARTIQTVAVAPRVTRVLPRGNWMDETGEIVTPAVPACLPGSNDDQRRATRLDLARWLVTRDHPLTARVFVNRLWKLYFGTGLSRALDDLGTRGEWPAHADLLDWLAVEFMDSGWDVKHMVRLIVTSSTYRQSSVGDARLVQRDPLNRLIGRQSVFRLEAELIRDNALAISGLLTRTVGGSSAKPYQPDDYYRHLNFPPRVYVADKGERQYRRGVYTHWQRSFLHPALLAFDAPSREECTAERPLSNTPTAALVLLNDPSFVEAARVLAARIIDEGGESFEDRVVWAWRRALGRRPTPPEVEFLKRLFEAEREHFAGNPRAGESLTAVGQSPVRRDLDVAELAAWTSLARAMLNLSETITRN